MKKNILVTGGAGFIGSNLIPELLKSTDFNIIVIDNESTGKLNKLEHLPIQCIKGEFWDEKKLPKGLDSIHSVIHLAADTRVQDSIVDPVKNFNTNVVGTFQLLSLAREWGVKKFINASTGGAILGECNNPVDENMPANPISPYGASKLAIEGYCSAFNGSYAINTVSLRFANVYGPASLNKKSVVANFIKKILDNEQITINGDGSQQRDFVFVEDIARGIHSALKSNSSGIFQLGSGNPTTILDLVNALEDVTGIKFKQNIVFKPAIPGEIQNTWCNISKAKNILNFSPNKKLKDGLSETWEWFKVNYTREKSK